MKLSIFVELRLDFHESFPLCRSWKVGIACIGGKLSAYVVMQVCSAAESGCAGTEARARKKEESKMSRVYNFSAGPATLPEEVLQDGEGLQTMRTMGRNMAWLLRCIEAGKAAGIEAPAAESGARTNFIR